MKRPLRAGAAFALGSPRARSPSRPPAPTDLSAEVSGGGPELRLSLRRAGHLVALGDGTTRAAGEDSGAVTLDLRSGKRPCGIDQRGRATAKSPNISRRATHGVCLPLDEARTRSVT